MKRIFKAPIAAVVLSVCVWAVACATIGERAAVQPLSFGAIADCQYADLPPSGEKLYRSCPGKLEAAIEDLNAAELEFVVHLGDFIDQKESSFAPLLAITAKLEWPIRHVLGNHDFSVSDSFKSRVPQTLGLTQRYYTFAYDRWRFVVLDGNDVSTYGWPDGSSENRRNRSLLETVYNGEEDWNGGIGREQLDWFEDVLEKADSNDERVVIFCHFGAYPENPHNLWNADEVLTIIDRHRSVTAWFNGHNHKGNYGERNGVHFVNLVGMLDTSETAYAVVNLAADKIQVVGRGRQPDWELLLE